MKNIGLDRHVFIFAFSCLFVMVSVATSPLILLAENQKDVYTCSMHPQVRLESQGKCPICGMPLILAQQASSTDKDKELTVVTLSEHARAMASVESVEVTPMRATHNVRAVGKVAYNETALSTITTRVDGYAERLYVNFTGIDVNKGDHLAEIYSPDLVVAQQEVLIALRSGEKGVLLDSTLLKLERLGLSEQQLKALVESRKVTERVTLYSPISGTVISRNITQSGAFKAGDALYQIANLDTVWVYLDVYESQLPWLQYGQKVDLVTESLPGKTFEGMVTFVSPLVDEESRTVKVPVHIENKDHALKPGMFMSATIKAGFSSSGHPAATGVEGKFTCPMHPQVLQDKAGTCPFCGMDLKVIPKNTSATHDKVLAVPATAVLDSGQRKFVYVERERGVFVGREVTLGPRADTFYPVLSGLSEGERVAIRGNFLLDSQAQINGAASLFYPHGAAGVTAHQHEAKPPSNEKVTTPVHSH